MRVLLIILCGLVVARCPAEVQQQVAEGDADEQSLLRVGTFLGAVKRDGREEQFRFWLSVCQDLPHSEALRVACAEALRKLAPQPSILVSGFPAAGADLPAADGPWLFAVGSRVTPALMRTVLRVVHEVHPGPLVLQGWNDGEIILSVGPVIGEPRTPADDATIERLLGEVDERTMRTLLGEKPKPPAIPFLVDGAGEILLDLDLRSPAGTPAVPASSMPCIGVTWTAEGLFLPGHRLMRYPPHFPSKDEDAPIPTAAYTADIIVPGLTQESVTVTLVLCQASNELERDNLFSLGRHSRWLSAQVGRDGGVQIGLDNRWILMPVVGDDQKPMTLSVGKWHVLTVGSSADGRLLRVAIDGHAAQDSRRLDNNSNVPPRPFNDPTVNVLSFVDPGNPRHLHGLLRRVIVHRGMLNHATITALHQAINASLIPVPSTPVFNTPLTGTGLPSDEPPKPLPQNANDF